MGARQTRPFDRPRLRRQTLVALAATCAAGVSGCDRLPILGGVATRSGDASFVAREHVHHRGTADLYMQQRERDICLRLVRRWDGRADRWRSCGLRRGRDRLDLHTRISCAAKEMHYLGLAPRRTRRLVAKRANGRRVRVTPYSAPAALRVRGKPFMIVSGRELGGRLRAIGASGRTIDSAIIHLIRGPVCGHPSPRDAKPLPAPSG